MHSLRYLLLPALLWMGCQTNTPTTPALFESLPSEKTGINFINEVTNQEDFNIFTYRNFYNGGGVGIGDINNDGLPDVYLTKNMAPNALYLNKGDFKFEDITESSGTAGTRGWSTGVAFVDINADGWLDIYVCNAGYTEGDDQQNELFVNNQDGTFSEKAADYNLNENGYTTHAAFFDYDLDGDLDCYILNNSFIPVNTLNYSNKRELKAEDWPVADFLKGGGDKLLRNNNGKFEDVTEEAGIYSSLIGFGLGVTVGDVNGDHLPDLYISNDFFERDYLYINQGNGTFSEEIKDWMQHLSHASMGTDMADINNDGYPEIFATEMLPESDYRRKTTTLFQNYNIYQLHQQRDFYHQYMQNTLQLNNRDGSFSEIAWYAGVAATDWSWGALFFDANGDGLQDIFVCNGVYQDVTDQDFMDFFADEVIQKMVMTGEKKDFEKVVSEMPSVPLPNKFFLNQGDLSFADKGNEYGFDQPTFSNGAAYADLDNDGDLDLIINNLKQQALVYRNHTDQQENQHYLRVQLKGNPKNPFAVGAKLFLHRGNAVQNIQLVPTRGFQSSVDYTAVFGLGENPTVDSLVVIWPDRQRSSIKAPSTDRTLTLDWNKLTKSEQQPIYQPNLQAALLAAVPVDLPKHREDSFIDFYEEGLIIRMLSREGPTGAVGDLNGDGLDDIFLGSSEGSFDRIFLQTAKGFEEGPSSIFERDSYSETTAVNLFDADGDEDLDLYIGTGGNNLQAGPKQFRDRLYYNDGKGNFELAADAIPNIGLNTSVVLPFDLDDDGDLDLFVGSRSIPRNYGLPPRSYLLENNGQGKFTDVTKEKAPDLEKLGMITGVKRTNIDADPEQELLIVGEWMSPKILEIKDGQLQLQASNLENYKGWWYEIEVSDLDKDGDQDLILGNRGENFYFSGTPEAPAKLWINDFDQNGTIEKLITQNLDGRDMPVPMKKELTAQVPALKKENTRHDAYAKKSIQELFDQPTLGRGYVLEANYFKSAVALNDGQGNFELQALPPQVQFSCVCGIYCADLNGDQQVDLLLGGNEAGFMPQFSKLDASYGHTLLNQGDGKFSYIPNQEAGFFVKGDVKELLPIQVKGEPHVLVLVNSHSPKLFRIQPDGTVQ